MNKRPNAAKAERRTAANEKAPSVAVAKGRKKINQQSNFKCTKAKQQLPIPQTRSPGIPLATELYELLQHQGATVADAPSEALADHPTVMSWHNTSGGFGRLSDQVHILKAWLRVTRSEFFIATTGIKVGAGGRNGIVKAYTLRYGVPVADCRQLGLFAEGDEQ